MLKMSKNECLKLLATAVACMTIKSSLDCKIKFSFSAWNTMKLRERVMGAAPKTKLTTLLLPPVICQNRKAVSNSLYKFAWAHCASHEKHYRIDPRVI